MAGAKRAETWVEVALDRQRRGFDLGVRGRVIVELMRLFPDGCFTPSEAMRVGQALGASEQTTRDAVSAVRSHTGLCEPCVAGSVAAQR